MHPRRKRLLKHVLNEERQNASGNSPSMVRHVSQPIYQAVSHEHIKVSQQMEELSSPSARWSAVSGNDV